MKAIWLKSFDKQKSYIIFSKFQKLTTEVEKF